MTTITKKPFHESILDRIERRARNVLASSRDEEEMMEFGAILIESVLPKNKVPEIAACIRSIAEKLSDVGDEASAHRYLLGLAEHIEKEG